MKTPGPPALLAAGGVDKDSDAKTEFVPNSEYTRYIPKDLNFEDVCYRSAVLKEPINNCVRMPRYPFDINMFMMPMAYEDEQCAYCTFSQVLLPKEDDNLISNISRETAANVLATCIKLRGDKPFGEIMQEVVSDIRGICDAERCCVLLMDENQRTYTILGEAVAPGCDIPPMKEHLGEDFFDLAETWLDLMNKSFCLIIRDEEDMEFIRQRNPKWHKTLVETGIQKLVLFPLFSRGHFLGYIWALNFKDEDTPHIKDTLELTTYFIASEIASQQFIEQLRTVSKMDQLTGVMNRNAMNERIASLTETSGMAVIFADMNGLKQVNDCQGHEEGDQLLKNAAMILQSTFTGAEIYRAGGDEFMILMSGTNSTDVEGKIREIKTKAQMFENVSFSVGYSLLDEEKEIRNALSKADQRMYGDKQRYYENGGFRRYGQRNLP